MNIVVKPQRTTFTLNASIFIFHGLNVDKPISSPVIHNNTFCLSLLHSVTIFRFAGHRLTAMFRLVRFDELHLIRCFLFWYIYNKTFFLICELCCRNCFENINYRLFQDFHYLHILVS